jgi:formylglycine-generating enzyme required for sulfatase activity
MTKRDNINSITKTTEAILGAPFEWCFVDGGTVNLIDASDYGGTQGGSYQVDDFAIAKYLITNSQYQKFIDHPNGFCNTNWWIYSPEGSLWRRDHRSPKPTAFPGVDFPVTRVSWFDNIAFCSWLSSELGQSVRLPTEQEWQRAAVGDTGWHYPWGNEIDETRANFANKVKKTSPVGSYPAGKSPFGVMDMVGNLWEWNLTIWGTDNNVDPKSYVYRNYRGGAWNVSNPEYLRATDRGVGHSPRGRLNDAGFRIVLQLD